MASSDPRPGSAGWPRSIRRKWAVPLSVALHAAAFYAVGLVPWAASELPAAPVPLHRVVWLPDSPPPTASPIDPAEANVAIEAPPLPAPAPPDEPAASVARVPPLLRAPPERLRARATAPAPVAPTVPPALPPEPAQRGEQAATPSGAATPAAPGVPPVDWEKERHDAVHDVLEQRAQRRDYLTFSLDDVVKKELEPVDPVRPPLVVDNCVIVKGRLQRFAALMTGRCVREARGDLFAAIKPAYLKSHPVCIETRPENPGSFLSDGTQISTVKCELVANEEQ
jgi:hypothetical protein